MWAARAYMATWTALMAAPMRTQRRMRAMPTGESSFSVGLGGGLGAVGAAAGEGVGEGGGGEGKAAEAIWEGGGGGGLRVGWRGWGWWPRRLRGFETRWGRRLGLRFGWWEQRRWRVGV